MLKALQFTGLFQIYVGGGLFLGFIVTAFGQGLVSGFFFGTVLLIVCFQIIRDTMGIANKNPDKRFNQLVIPVAIFYGVCFALFVLTFAIGLMVGI